MANYMGGTFAKGSIAATIVTEALDLAPPGSRQHGQLLSRYADMLDSSVEDQNAGTAALGQALEIALSEDDAAMAIEVLSKLARRHYVQLEYQQYLGSSTRAIELFPRADQPPDINVYWNAVRALIGLGRVEEARPYAAHQLELAEESGSKFVLTQALHASGYLALRLGDWVTARGFSNRGLELDGQDVRLLY
jgi:tetratricopeptide (TPR) repeat protein